MREGSLEAPTRHPIDWKSPDYYDEEQLSKELERVYDICHGCRRCVSLCTAFPTLFDLVDASSTLEVDGVKKEDFWKVVDQCYLCDLCYMTKCPYVPPHPWNVDFPHLMLRAKAVKYKKVGASFRDKLLSSTDALGKLASIPVVVQAVNLVNKTPATRKVMDAVLGIDKDRVLPEYTSATFRRHAHTDADFPIKEGKSAPGKVAIYSTCYVNYNEPGIGNDLLRVLAHNEIPTIVVDKENCCGMPKLELGDLDAVEKLKDGNLPTLAKLAREGYAILTPIPSCTLMFKQELPLLFPNDADLKLVAKAMFDPFEYLSLRHKDGLLNTQFTTRLGKVSYHVPCHLRVQNMGLRTQELLKLVPGTELNTVERCSGHDGTWGVKKEYFANSMKIGRPVFRAMAGTEPDYISSDCPIAGRHIVQGMEANAPVTAPGRQSITARKEHPITLIRIAYGL